jgi:hypothetical protein
VLITQVYEKLKRYDIETDSSIFYAISEDALCSLLSAPFHQRHQDWVILYDRLLDIMMNRIDINKKSLCECGAEKTYGLNATHSFWCPRYKADQ